MQSLSTLLLLTAGAFAAPAPAPQFAHSQPIVQTLPPGYQAPWAWFVSGWEAGCQRSGCSYNFNVSVPANPGQPNYGQYYCNGEENGGYGLENYFTPCKSWGGYNGIEAAARLSRREGENKDVPRTIEISVLIPGVKDQKPPYNFTGYGDVTYNRFVTPALEFNVYPDVWQQLPYPQDQN